MKKNVWLALFNLVLIATFALSACAQPTAAPAQPPAAGQPTAAPAQPTAAPAAGQMVTIRWRTRPDNKSEQDAYQKINDELNKQLASQGITLQYDPAPVTGYMDKLTAEFSAGNAPDIVWIPGASTADYASKGVLLDLMPLVKADTSFKLSDYYDAPIKELEHNGALWGLPRDISTLVMYYNKDLFKAKGITDPAEAVKAGNWNWDEFRKDAIALTDTSKKVYGFSFSNWWGLWGWFANAGGGGLFNADRTACGLASEGSQKGLQFMADLFQKDKVSTAPGQEGSASETTFLAGQVAMFPNGRWFTPSMRENAKFDWGVVEMPEGPGGKSTWLFWGGYDVAAKTKYPQQAWTVLKALTSAEVQAQVAALGTNIPSNKAQAAVDAFLNSKPPADNQPFIAGAAYAQAEIPLFTGNWGDIVDAQYQPAIDKILQGKASVADATKAACDATNPLFKSDGAAKPAVAPTAAAPAEMVTIRWRTRPDNKSEQDAYQKINDELNKQLASQGITLQYDPAPVTGYMDKLTAEFSAGNAPDIVWIPGASTADYASKGVLLDLMPLVKADTSFKLSDYYDAPIKELEHGGALWGLPRDISTLVMYYNKDLFKAKGITDPAEAAKAGNWNWDEFRKDAIALTDTSKKVYGFSFSNWWGLWGWFANAGGGGLFNADRTACGLASEGSQKGLQFMADLFQKDKVSTAPGQEGSASETTFLAGQVAMFPNGRWFTPSMRENAKFDWGVVEMPEGPGGKSTWLFWGGYDVAAKTKYPQQAWTVLKALTSAEVQAQVAALGTNIPSNKAQAAVDAFLNSKPPADNQPFIAGAAYAQAEIPLFTGNWGDIVDAQYQPAIDKILQGKASVADATKAACDAADPLFKK